MVLKAMLAIDNNRYRYIQLKSKKEKNYYYKLFIFKIYIQGGLSYNNKSSKYLSLKTP